MSNVISFKKVHIIGIVLVLLVITSIMVVGYYEDTKELKSGFLVKSEQFNSILNIQD